MQSLSTKILALVMFITIACAAKPATAAQPVRVACVGDSITFGAGVPNNWVNAWPGQLQKMLGKHYKVANFGHSGATLLKDGDLPYWKTPEYKHSTAFKGKIVIIMLGTNDTKAWNWKHHAHFVHDLTALVKHYQSLTTNVKVWLCLPPPVLKSSYGINEKNMVGGVIPDIKIVAAKLHLPMINVHDGMHHNASLLQHDGVHPNAKGQHVMAEIIRRAILRK